MDVETIDRETRKVDREIMELARTRPGPALAAERGDPKALAELDGKLEKLRDRKENLASARVAMKWEEKRALEAEAVPLVKKALGEWRNVRRGLSALVTGLGQYSENRKALDDLLGRRIRMTAVPTPQMPVLLGVIRALGLDPHALPYLNPDVATLEAEEAVFSKILDEFAARAASSPRAMAKVRPEDHGTGVLGAMTVSARALAR
jgi:hypothetical protein